MAEKDLYKLLGVPRTASDKEIRSAYRRLLRQYHPDVYRGDPSVASANTRELTSAYDTLIDPGRRAHYDSENYRPPPTPPASHYDAVRPPAPPHIPIVPSVTFRPPPPVRPRPVTFLLKTVYRLFGPIHVRRARASPIQNPAAQWQRTPSWLVRERAEFRKALRIYLVVFLVFIGGVAVGALWPISHSFGFNVGSGLGGVGVCTTPVTFPQGAQVTFAWATTLFPTNGTTVPPDIVVNGGGYYFSSTAAQGSSSFVAYAGTYDFSNWNCQFKSVQFSGHYTTTIL